MTGLAMGLAPEEARGELERTHLLVSHLASEIDALGQAQERYRRECEEQHQEAEKLREELQRLQVRALSPFAQGLAVWPRPGDSAKRVASLATGRQSPCAPSCNPLPAPLPIAPGGQRGAGEPCRQGEGNPGKGAGREGQVAAGDRVRFRAHLQLML